MLIDNNLYLSDAQAVTTTGTSTYYIDMLSTGFGHNDELYAQFLINTAMVVTAASSITMAIWVANETTFASQTLVASRLILWSTVTTLTGTVGAGVVLATMHIGPDIYKQDGTTPYRYLYARYTLDDLISGGKIDSYLVKDIDMTMDKVK